MPITCPGKQKVRYRWKGNVRLAFCGNTVVETKQKGGRAHKVKKRKK